ncbi:MAG: hypothetical protein PHN82_03775 [bacterium]|nr:hypothetical protein [bacterium]
MRHKSEYACIALFSLLALIMLVHHEPWRDEAQGWLIARDSPTFLSVVRQMNREGTPGLWFYMAYPLARSGLDFRSAQAFNFATILCIVLIVMRYAPFPRHQRILFIFGYYIMYEYAVIVRTYGLSMLFLVAIAALYNDRFRRPIAYAALIFLLANTNVHGIIVAAVLTAAYLFEAVRSGDAQSAGGVRTALLLMALGLAAAMCQTISREERAEVWAGWHWELSHARLRELCYALQLAFLPVSGHPFFPRLEINFWGSVLVHNPACVLVAAPLFCLSLLILLKKRMPVAIYCCSTAGLLALFWLKYPGARRHIGFIYMSFIVARWISDCYRDAASWPKIPFREGTLSRLFTLLLSLQLLGSAQAFYYELRYDFSPAKRAASFLKEHGYVGEDVLIAAFPSTTAQAIPLFLPPPHSRLFQVESERYGSYAAHTREFKSAQSMPIEEVIRRVDDGIRGGAYRRVLLILNERRDDDVEFTGRYSLLASFEEHIAEDEPMYIYQLKSRKGV